MENASKALIMAGGIFLAILIITVLVYAWSLFSKYQSSHDELKDIDDLTRFNLEFTNFDRDDVQGYELITLANKVADYNYRYSNHIDAKNDAKYNPITLIIRFPNGRDDLLKFSRDETKLYLFNQNDLPYEQTKTKNEIKKIIDDALTAESYFGGQNTASMLAKNIDSVFPTDETMQRKFETQGTPIDIQKVEAVRTFNSYLPSSASSYRLSDSEFYKLRTRTYYEVVYKYYEYIQFKRGVFKCKNLTYDNIGRVSKIEFEFSGRLR